MSGEIYKLIPKIMSEVPEIKKLRVHSQQKWSYRGFEDFLNAFQPALLKHGLFIVPEVLDNETSLQETSNKAMMRHVVVRVAYSVFAPDGSMIRAVVIGESWDSQDNATTKALDDAFTTFLTQTFCVGTGEPIGGASTNNSRQSERNQQAAPAQQSRKEPSKSPSQQSNAPSSATVASIDSAKYFTFARENGIDHREAEEIRLACTAGGKVHWDRAIEELRKLVSSMTARSGPSAGLIKLNEILETLKQLGLSREALDAKLSKICDGICEVESLDETQTAKAIAVFNRDLQAKQAETQRRSA